MQHDNVAEIDGKLAFSFAAAALDFSDGDVFAAVSLLLSAQLVIYRNCRPDKPSKRQIADEMHAIIVNHETVEFKQQ